MSLASVRARILVTLSAAAVPGGALSVVAQVHDYFRTVTTEKELGERLVKSSKLHAWMISLAKDNAYQNVKSGMQPGHDPGQTFPVYRFHLYGYFGVDDATASEKAWADIVEGVMSAFRLDMKLGRTVVTCLAPQWEQGGGGEGCVFMPPGDKGRLCHFARITLVVQDNPLPFGD